MRSVPGRPVAQPSGPEKVHDSKVRKNVPIDWSQQSPPQTPRFGCKPPGQTNLRVISAEKAWSLSVSTIVITKLLRRDDQGPVRFEVNGSRCLKLERDF